MENFIPRLLSVKQKSIRENIQYIINRDDFILPLEKSLAVLKPLDMAIVHFQLDATDVIHYFTTVMKKQYTEVQVLNLLIYICILHLLEK